MTFEKETTSGPDVLGIAITDGSGVATWTLSTRLGANTYQATYAGNGSEVAASSNQVVTTGVRLTSTLRLRGPASVIDGHRITLAVTWRGPAARPIPGVVSLQQRPRGGVWQTLRILTLSATGGGSITIQPRVDTAYRAHGAAANWWQRATSPTVHVDNLPPAAAVVLPKNAPRAEPLPPQPRAFSPGPNITTSSISTRVWRSMVGRTWHAGCPVGRRRLRLLNLTYWGFDGYAHRGKLIVAARVAPNFVHAFAALYRGRYPVRAMYLVDRFGWSARAHGGDDFAAMQHDDTSAFDCRWVDGRPGILSPHAFGTALDLNTWENPYRSPQGLLPDRWWMAHSNPRYAWRSRSAPVVRLLARYGFHWTYGLGDTQHFDVR